MNLLMELYFDLAGIKEAAKKFLEATSGFTVYAFSGDLGAGKTTFIGAVCSWLGVTEAVTSPTFAIIQEYEAAEEKIIYHIDLYRINSRREAMDAGIEDCLTSGAICLVEWPEKAPEIFPDNTVFINIMTTAPDSRKLIVQLPR
jgi:tRNA threonylcarbamoyladenosine biosynthesis protein TsaE